MALFSRKKKGEIPPVDHGLVCENCRTPIPGNTNLCPKCGLNPSIDTMQRVYEPGVIRRSSRRKEE